MDMMAIRRRVLMSSGKKDYLKGVEWALKRFIDASGGKYDSNITKYTTNAIYLDSGTYLLKGIQVNMNGAVNYRIHQYDANDVWIKQLQAKQFFDGDINYQITLAEPSYVRLSIAISFDGTLTKM